MEKYEIAGWCPEDKSREVFGEFDDKNEALNEWHNLKTAESSLFIPSTVKHLEITASGVTIEQCYWDAQDCVWVFSRPVASRRELSILLGAISDAKIMSRIYEWDLEAWDFLKSTVRSSKECEKRGVPWWPTNKQVLYLARLHSAFVDSDGLGTDIINDIENGNALLETGESYSLLPMGSEYKNARITPVEQAIVHASSMLCGLFDGQGVHVRTEHTSCGEIFITIEPDSSDGVALRTEYTYMGLMRELRGGLTPVGLADRIVERVIDSASDRLEEINAQV